MCPSVVTHRAETLKLIEASEKIRLAQRGNGTDHTQNKDDKSNESC